MQDVEAEFGFQIALFCISFCFLERHPGAWHCFGWDGRALASSRLARCSRDVWYVHGNVESLEALRVAIVRRFAREFPFVSLGGFGAGVVAHAGWCPAGECVCLVFACCKIDQLEILGCVGACVGVRGVVPPPPPENVLLFKLKLNS